MAPLCDLQDGVFLYMLTPAAMLFTKQHLQAFVVATSTACILCRIRHWQPLWICPLGLAGPEKSL